MAKTHLSRGLAATVTVLGTAVAVTVLALFLLVPLVGSVREFLHDLPATVQQLRDSDELSWLGDSGAAENVQEGAQQVSAVVPDAISAVLGIAGGFFSIFLAAFMILFICLFLLTDIANLKRVAGERAHARRGRRWLGVWERVTIGLALGDRRRHHRDDRGHHPGRDRLAARLELRARARVIAGLLDMIPNIGATIAGFILVPTLWAEEGLTAALIMLAVVLVYQQLENSILTPKIQGKAVNLSAVLHHRRGHAVRRPARRARRAHRCPACGDDPDPRAGADEGAAREGGRGESGALRWASVVCILAGVLVAAIGTSAGARASESRAAAKKCEEYTYGGVEANQTRSGARARIVLKQTAKVAWGHAAAWIGVGGRDKGPNGTDQWLQAGYTGFDTGETFIYYEVTKPNKAPQFHPIGADIKAGESHEIAVLETKKNTWQVLLDGKAASPEIVLPESNGKFKPQLLGESWTGGTGKCNQYPVRVQQGSARVGDPEGRG